MRWKIGFGQNMNLVNCLKQMILKQNNLQPVILSGNLNQGHFNIPGIGEVLIGVNQLQESGVQFCVCAAAINVYSAATAQAMNLKHEDVKKDFTNAILPGIQPVPSGVWALGRAQEKRCGYIFAG